MSFKTGQLVRITDTGSLAYGRIGRVLQANQGRSRIRFVDPSRLILEVSSNCLEAVTDIPSADSYLLLTIAVEIDRGVRYVQTCLAYGVIGQTADELAHEVVRAWYPGGEWDEINHCLTAKDLRLVIHAQAWKEISAAEYADLHIVLEDCTPSNHQDEVRLQEYLCCL